jgi:hypothetical protein
MTSPETRQVGWNDTAILKALGWTPANIRRVLISQKQATADEPTDWAIYQWTSRGKIASAWRPRLLYCALRLDRITLAEAFRVDGATPQPVEPVEPELADA